MYPLLDTSCLDLTNLGTGGGRMNFSKCGKGGEGVIFNPKILLFEHEI